MKDNKKNELEEEVLATVTFEDIEDLTSDSLNIKENLKKNSNKILTLNGRVEIDDFLTLGTIIIYLIACTIDVFIFDGVISKELISNDLFFFDFLLGVALIMFIFKVIFHLDEFKEDIMSFTDGFDRVRYNISIRKILYIPYTLNMFYTFNTLIQYEHITLLGAILVSIVTSIIVFALSVGIQKISIKVFNKIKYNNILNLVNSELKVLVSFYLATALMICVHMKLQGIEILAQCIAVDITIIVLIHICLERVYKAFKNTKK